MYEVGIGSEPGISCSHEQTLPVCINTVCSSVQIIDRYSLDHHMAVHEEALVFVVLIKVCCFFCPRFSHYPASNCALACQLPAAKFRACFIDEGTLKTKGVFSSATVPLGIAIRPFTALYFLSPCRSCLCRL